MNSNKLFRFQQDYLVAVDEKNDLQKQLEDAKGLKKQNELL